MEVILLQLVDYPLKALNAHDNIGMRFICYSRMNTEK